MPQIEELRSLAAKDIEPCPSSWLHVYHLMIVHDSPVNSDLGAVVATSGEASISSYTRDSIAPMYISTIYVKGSMLAWEFSWLDPRSGSATLNTKMVGFNMRTRKRLAYMALDGLR